MDKASNNNRSIAGEFDRRTLGVFNFDVPEFETYFHLLNRLNERHELELKIYVTTRMCRAEPRVLQLYDEARIRVRKLPSKVMKYFSRGLFKGMDAVLVLSDPFLDRRPPHRRRIQHMVDLNLPTIFLQHGVIQGYINDYFKSEQLDYYSAQIFVMEYPKKIHQSNFTEDTLARIKVSGFIKKPCFVPNPLKPSIANRLSNYGIRLLFCQSFRSTMHSRKKIPSFYLMIEQFANDNPHVAVIVRSHRGKRRKEYADFDRKIAKKCTNVFLMYLHHGPLKRMSITDAISICDFVISTPSTAILDAIYMAKPAAVYLNEDSPFPVFSGLPQITDAHSIEKFINNECGNSGAESLISRYGNFDENINRTCAEIERLVSQLPKRS